MIKIDKYVLIDFFIGDGFMLFGTQKVIGNELYIGGMSVSKLVEKHGSPLYVYDEQYIEEQIDLFQKSFRSDVFDTRVAYASKAFMTLYMAQLLERKNMSMDCVSLGEMYTAKRAGFNMKNAIIHGNNKSVLELEMAVKEGSLIVVDNDLELGVLSDIAKKLRLRVNTLLRVNPGIEAHTHEYIITANLTSKFGESIFDLEKLDTVAGLYKNSEFVHLRGFHCHIGSQIQKNDAFIETIHVMTDFIKDFEERYDMVIDMLNLGGGFGVYYTEEDHVEELGGLLRHIIKELEIDVLEKELHVSEVIIEPGRSIISNAGTTLYTVGYQKETYGGKNYLFVDGGMTDNIRPALYQAKYSCDIATNMFGLKNLTYTVAGKLCESGDVLINDALVQEFHKDDILAIYTTGAYNYTMASNYNRMLKPEVVFVKDGKSKIVVKRETLEDLIRNDL
jgi:diaminopimelate decarboxylase